MSESVYARRLKQSKRGMVFCSSKCSSMKNNSTIKCKCGTCGKNMLLNRWDYNSRLKNSNSNKLFCSNTCSLTGRKVSRETKQKLSQSQKGISVPSRGKSPSEEVRKKISSSQKGISVMSRGRKGRILPENVKEKIRRSKIGIPSIKDNDIILNDLKTRDYDKAITTIKVIPDAIMVKNGKLIALEVEKKKYEYDIRKKMDNYINDEFDKVIISWYLPNGEKVRDFVRENGIWN